MTRLYIIQLEKAGDKDVPVHGIIHVDTNDNLSSHQVLTKLLKMVYTILTIEQLLLLGIPRGQGSLITMQHLKLMNNPFIF